MDFDDNETILVYEYNECRWSISQMNNVQKRGLRLCFINENDFIYFYKDVYLYSFNNANRRFENVNIIYFEDIAFEWFRYPLQFIKSKKMLMVVGETQINILRQENNKFILDQSIQSKAQQIQASISDDGEYLLTWDKISSELQVRKMMMIH